MTAPRSPRSGRVGVVGWLGRVIVGSVVLGALVVGGTAVRVWQVARIDDLRRADVLVVLGAAQYDGTPSSVFQARLDRAFRLYRAGVSTHIVTVGGKQDGDVFTEAASGKSYLVDRGVPASDVLAVQTGSDTLGSVEAVARIVHDHHWSTAVLVSDPWHSLRTRTMARDAGLTAWTAPTRTGPAVYTRESQAHGIARETLALLWYQLTHFSADFRYSGSQ